MCETVCRCVGCVKNACIVASEMCDLMVLPYSNKGKLSDTVDAASGAKDEAFGNSPVCGERVIRMGTNRSVSGAVGRRSQAISADKGKLGCTVISVPCEVKKRQRQEMLDDFCADIAEWRAQGVDTSELEDYVKERVVERDKLLS